MSRLIAMTAALLPFYSFIPHSLAELTVLDTPSRVLAPTRHCFAVAFSSDGEFMAAFFPRRGVTLFKWPEGEELASITIEASGFGPLAYSSTGMIAAGGAGQRNLLLGYPLEKQLEIVVETRRAIFDVAAFSPDGGLLAAGDHDGAVLIHKSATGELDRQLEGHIGTVWALAWALDGSRIASASADNDICVWNVASGRLDNRIDSLTHAVFAMAWSRDGKSLFHGGASATLSEWSSESRGMVRESARQQGLIQAMAISADESLVCTGGLHPDGFELPADVIAFDRSTLQPIKVLHAHKGAVTGIAFSADFQHIVSVSIVEPGIKVWKNPAIAARILD
jgi:WD40 repeat protein